MPSIYKRSQPTKRKRKNRSREEVHREALVAARELLLEGGPGAITVAKVAGKVGMSHANLLHHFGSAAALHSALMGSMVTDLTDAFGDVVKLLKDKPAGPREVVDKVFDAFDQGGAGPLASWIILSDEIEHLEPVRVAVTDLVDAIVTQAQDDEANSRVRLAVLMMAIAAYGDSMIGPHIREMLDQDDQSTRQLMSRILPLFLVPSGIPGSQK